MDGLNAAFQLIPTLYIRNYTETNLSENLLLTCICLFLLQVGHAIINDYIFVHLSYNIDKLNLLMSVSLFFNLI